MTDAPLIQIVWEDWADQTLPLPTYETAGAAGADLRVNLRPEDRADGLVLAPMARAILPTGLRIEIPAGYEVQIRPRSGLAAKFGLTIPNAPGTIDSDYRGEIKVPLINHGKKPIKITRGDRIAQMVVAPVSRVAWKESATLETTSRGAGGFGSSGHR